VPVNRRAFRRLTGTVLSGLLEQKPEEAPHGP